MNECLILNGVEGNEVRLMELRSSNLSEGLTETSARVFDFSHTRHSSRELLLHHLQRLIIAVWFNMASRYVACIDKINCVPRYTLDYLHLFVLVLCCVV